MSIPTEHLQNQEKDDVIESAKELLHLHSCEQEGLQSGKPTPKMWFDAVNKLSDAVELVSQQPKPIDDGQEGKGLRWVKANDQLPDRDKDVIVRSLRTNKVKVTRNMGHNSGWDISMDWDFKWDNTEWLDESAALPLADGEGEKPKIQTCPNCGSDADEIGDAGDGYYTCIYCGNRFPVRPSKPLLPSAVTGGVKWVKAILEQIKLRVGEKGFGKDANKQSDLYLFVSDVIAQLSEGQPAQGKE